MYITDEKTASNVLCEVSVDLEQTVDPRCKNMILYS